MYLSFGCELFNFQVINLYFELLKEREKRNPKEFLKCHFFNTFFYKKVGFFCSLFYIPESFELSNSGRIIYVQREHYNLFTHSLTQVWL